MPTVHLLDYVAGNVRSLVNAIEKVGYTVSWIKEPQDVEDAEVGDIMEGCRCFRIVSPSTEMPSRRSFSRV